MMQPLLFIDTGAFLALEDESDKHHHEALNFRNEILRKKFYKIITTSYVLDEILTLIRVRISISASIDFCRKIRSSNVVTIHSITEEDERIAMDMFEQYDDKTFSFTDCTSFVVMRKMGISEVFGFDRHFEHMRFTLRP
jgi:uncharacterized protein